MLRPAFRFSAFSKEKFVSEQLFVSDHSLTIVMRTLYPIQQFDVPATKYEMMQMYKKMFL